MLRKVMESITNFGREQGIPGVVVNIHGFGDAEQTGNIRVRREAGFVVIDIFRHGRWCPANSFDEADCQTGDFKKNLVDSPDFDHSPTPGIIQAMIHTLQVCERLPENLVTIDQAVRLCNGRMFNVQVKELENGEQKDD